jgi:hypothetical protein
VAYFTYLDRWRNSGKFDGLEFTRVSTMEPVANPGGSA